MTTNSDFIGFYTEIEKYAKQQQFKITSSNDSNKPSSTTGVIKSITATLWPTTLEHVQYIVAQANIYLVPLHPIGSGKNWGYSDATPSCDNSVIINLSAMNKVLQIDQENNFAIIEPGVTQQQLSDALAGTRLFMDCTGASTGSSVIGNILERGFGHTPFGDRFGHSCSYEIVLGNGEILRTGHLAYKQLDTYRPETCHSPRTTGPAVEGLFSQSNFGIVTKLCIWLMTRPPRILPFVAVFKTHEDFLNAIAPLSRLKALGVARSTMHIGNGMRLISSSIGWQGGDNLMPTQDIERQLKQLGIGPWIMSGALYGTKSMIKAYKKELVSQIKASSEVSIKFLEPALINAVANALNRLPKQFFIALKTQLETAQGLINMHSGTPTDLFLKGCYHRHSNGYPKVLDEQLDVAKDGCGLIWLSPTTAANKQSVSTLLKLLTDIFEQQGFNLYATLSFINERSIAVICNPIFDVNNSDEVIRAQECTTKALKMCIDSGFPPYRVANVHWELFYEQLSQQQQGLLTAIKHQLDPNNIISPGRYGIGKIVTVS